MAKTATVRLVLKNEVVPALKDISTQLVAFSQKIEAAFANVNFGSKIQKESDKAKSGLAGLSKGLFGFRDKLTGAFNVIPNLIATTFRRLARLRTAFFILITFLAVRPLIRFAQGILDESARGNFALQSFRTNYGRFKTILSERFTPAIEAILAKAIDAVITFIGYLSENKAIIPAVLTGIEGIVDAIKALTNAFLAAIEGANVLTYTLQNILGKDAVSNRVQNIEDNLKTLTDRLAEYPIKLARVDAEIALVEARRKKASGDPFFDFVKFDKEINELKKQKTQFLKDFFAPLRDVNNNLIEVPTSGLGVGIRGLIEQLNKEKAKIVNSGFITSAQQAEEAYGRLSTYSAAALQNVKDIITLSPAWKVISDLIQAGFSGAVEDVKKTKEEVSALELQLNDFVDGFADGLTSQLKTVRELSEELGKAIRDGIVEGLGDTILNIIRGRLSKIKDVLADTLKAFQRSIANFIAQTSFDALANFGKSVAIPAVGTLLGLGGTSAAPAGPPKADGGMVFGRQLAQIGETPEAFVPLKGGAIPVRMSGGGRAGNIVIAPSLIDGASFGVWLSRPESKRLIRNAVKEGAGGSDAGLRNQLYG